MGCCQNTVQEKEVDLVQINEDNLKKENSSFDDICIHQSENQHTQPTERCLSQINQQTVHYITDPYQKSSFQNFKRKLSLESAFLCDSPTFTQRQLMASQKNLFLSLSSAYYEEVSFGQFNEDKKRSKF